MVQDVEAGWSVSEVAKRFRVSRSTASKWVRPYREEGLAGLEDRSSAPHSNPRRTPPEVEQRICAVRRSEGFGPHRIAWRSVSPAPPSTPCSGAHVSTASTSCCQRVRTGLGKRELGLDARASLIASSRPPADALGNFGPGREHRLNVRQHLVGQGEYEIFHGRARNYVPRSHRLGKSRVSLAGC